MQQTTIFPQVLEIPAPIIRVLDIFELNMKIIFTVQANMKNLCRYDHDEQLSLRPIIVV